jgi:Tol biopolymer transport system component
MGVLVPLVRTLVALSLLLTPIGASAQHFGRNKVEYEDFDFQILATEHFDIYYYDQEERAARMAARLAERWYARLSTLLNHQFDRRQPLVLYGSQAEFAQTNVVAGLLPDSVGGVTEGSRRRIVMPFAPTLAETDRVLGHELVHAFQFDIARHYGRDTGQPLWFIEGMAEYLSRGSLEPDSSLWLRDAVLSGRLPDGVGAAARDLSPYLFGHAFWSYLGSRFGDDIVEKSLKPGKKQRRLKDRMRHATGGDLEALYREWRTAVTDEHKDAREGRDRFPIWSRDSMQIGPSVSPDGARAVFFSERDRLSLDLFLSDLRTGQVIRKLATTAASAKFDSLQPLRSTGAWSPDGRWFAFAAVRQGRAALLLVDVGQGTGDREIVFSSLGQVLSLTWSPDGRSIAFSALAGGWTDLYVTEVATGSLRQLTDDAFADFQPAWSHDGRSIAFATERFSSDLLTLRIGRPQLAIMDVATNTARHVDLGEHLSHGSAGHGTHHNPQWSAGDRDLYFVGDVDGTANVLRVDLASSAVRRVTHVSTGVSGITPTGPALSVSADGSTIAFTVYKNGRPRLVVLDRAEADANERGIDPPSPLQGYGATGMYTIAAPASDSDAAFGRINRLLADDVTGLPDVEAMRGLDYKPRLQLEGIGQPYLSSGGGPFGTFVRGGGALLFGDMLGERKLGAAVQIGNRLRDAAFELRFLNQERRWTWGAVAELEPGLARFRTSEAIQHAGEPALLKQTEYFQRMQLRTAALLAYPFSRGLRVEMFAGVRHAAYHRDHRTQISSTVTGRVLESEQVQTRGGAPTTVAEAGAALVRDTTVFGPTGPLMGSRYRLEVAPAVGDLSYTTVIADVRRYLMPVRPFTVAMRLVHSARYGDDGNDPRLLPSYLGSSYFVRGHRQDLRYCRPDATRACDDDLLGNRMLVGNLEIRFPIWGLLSRQIEYGMFPIDAFFFADGGIISRSGIGDQGLASRRTGISSIGGGIRVNAGGLPLEVGGVRALDGPRPRWQFDLGFRVGF